jgi:RimJ/RimL family protein N-acetyltransferase
VSEVKMGLPIGPEVPTHEARRPDRTRIEGGDVVLTPIDVAAHGPTLYALSHGPEREAQWMYLWDGPYPSEAAFLENLAQKAVSADPFFFSIVERASGRAVGVASYLRITPKDRVIEVGSLLFTPALQRTRGATEAMFLMARHAFDTLGYRRYEWKCNALNAPSRRAAVRLGFQFEGIFRQHMIVKGRSRDTAWFAMIDRDWPAIRAAYAAWLDPANFGADGRQLTPLRMPSIAAPVVLAPVLPDPPP